MNGTGTEAPEKPHHRPGPAVGVRQDRLSENPSCPRRAPSLRNSVRCSSLSSSVFFMDLPAWTGAAFAFGGGGRLFWISQHTMQSWDLSTHERGGVTV